MTRLAENGRAQSSLTKPARAGIGPNPARMRAGCAGSCGLPRAHAGRVATGAMPASMARRAASNPAAAHFAQSHPIRTGARRLIGARRRPTVPHRARMRTPRTHETAPAYQATPASNQPRRIVPTNRAG
ncbi:hypothetical protein WS68_12300 [Burkholderia sp. TSV86]|nr:hypothetical protein WS68_12300 [Burkholderia sp. TSV86]